jgi:ketosteroid isomerase-like protein
MTYEQERKQLREIQGIFEHAVEHNDIEQLRAHSDPDFSYVSFSDRAFSDFDAFKQQWQLTRDKMIGAGSFKTQLNPEPSLFIDDIAVCHGNSTNQMVNNAGENFEFSSNWTVIFKRTAGEWKVLRAHNSLNPFSNPMLNQAIKKSTLKLGVGLFAAGGILCSLVTYLILR